MPVTLYVRAHHPESFKNLGAKYEIERELGGTSGQVSKGEGRLLAREVIRGEGAVKSFYHFPSERRVM